MSLKDKLGFRGLGLSCIIAGAMLASTPNFGCCGSEGDSPGISIGKKAKNKYVPQGFEDIHLGMSYEELQTVRPFVKTEEVGTASEVIKNKSEVYSQTDFDSYRTFLGCETGLPKRSEVMKLTVSYKFEDNKLQEITFTAEGGRGDHDLESDFGLGTYGTLETLATGEENDYYATSMIQDDQTWSADGVTLKFKFVDARHDRIEYSVVAGN